MSNSDAPVEVMGNELPNDQELLAKLMKASPDSIYFKDIKGRFLKVNDAIVKRFGLSDPGEIIGKRDFDFFDLEYARESFEKEKIIIATGEAMLDIVEKQIWADGRVTWASSSKVPLHDSSGHIIGILGTTRDITARKQAEEAGHKSEEKFRSLFSSSGDAIILLDRESFFDCNKATLTLFSSPSREDFIDKHPSEFLPPTQPDGEDSLVAFRAHVEAAYATGSQSFEWRYQRTDGSTFPAEVVLTRFELEDWPVLQVVVRDVSWRKTAETQLRQLSRAVEQSPSIVMITDTTGKIEYVNRKFMEVTGYSFEEAIGNTPRILKSGLTPPEVYQDLWATIGAGREWRGEIQNKKKNGELFWGSVTISSISNSAGAITQHLATNEDITERKRAEAELLAAKATAEAANRAKGEFLANMSHEIRTPMNGIIGITDLLLDTALTPEQRDYTQLIGGSAETLLTIINDILDFSKIEARKLTLEIIDFNLSKLVEDAISLGAERAHRKGVELLGFVEPDLPVLLRGDPGRLRQIIINLVGNAVKFTSEGEVFVVVSLESQTETEVIVRFEVRDTGLGMSEEVQGRLFQAFNQADSSTTRKFGGTGLGLAISKELVEMMGGEIGVVSKEGTGSTFWFTARFEKQPAVVQYPKLADVADLRLAGMRVLVVDDNVTNRQILNHRLASWKMEPTLVANGFEALNLLRPNSKAGPFDIAILDMQMPEMDGLMLARAIKADPRVSGMRLVILTSMGKLSSAEVTKAGVAACLVKPVKQSRLFDCLASVMAQPEATPSPVSAAPPPASTAKPELHNVRILVAEDHSVNQMVTLGQLKKLGYSGETVANGLEVLQALEAIPYDIVLMDCQMPKMDGYEATRLIRAMTAIPRQPYIIALTAHAMEGDREKCLAAGMDDYITKPLQLTDLRRVLRQGEEKISGQDVGVPGPDVAQAPGEVQTKSAFTSVPENEMLVDMERLNEISLEEPERMNQIIQLYFSQADVLVDDLKKAIADGAAPDIGRFAHKLLGSSSTCGMTAMVAPLAKLEKDSKTGDLSQANDLFAISLKYLNAIRALLADHLTAE